jgi:hypothetical protein
VFSISTSFYVSYRISQGPRPLVLISNVDSELCSATEKGGVKDVTDMLKEYKRDTFVEYWGNEHGEFGEPASMYWRDRDKGKGEGKESTRP